MEPTSVRVLVLGAMLATVPLVGSLAGDEAGHDTGTPGARSDAPTVGDPSAEALALARARAALDAAPPEAPERSQPPAELLAAARANLDAAERLRTLDEAPGSPLERALAAASIASKAQARVLDLRADATVAAVDHDRPSLALQALAHEAGADLSVSQRRALEDLDRLPDPLATALTDLVDAHLLVTATTDRAIGPVAPSQTGLSELLEARARVLDAILALEVALDAGSHTAGLTPSIVAPPAFAIDLGATDDVYEENVTLLVDAGGDDTYRNNAGGSAVDVGCRESPGLPSSSAPVPDAQVRPPIAAVAVDLGGDDRYVSGSGCGVNGGGQFGLGLLVDDGGEDVYRAGSRGVNGGAQGVGLGLLVDSGGFDRYEAGDDGANGGADGLIGISGQGGAGLLVDAGGNDTYTAGDEGINGGGWGSAFDVAGALVDLGGHDAYTGGHFSVNGGGWLGNGFLVDTGGDDRYVAGDDFGTVGVNGGAQIGVGFLYDDGGDDAYVAEVPQQAVPIADNGGAAGGIGLLLDERGDDEYRASGTSSNGGHGAALAGLALLVDAKGQDRYLDARVNCEDCTRVPKGTLGAQIDR